METLSKLEIWHFVVYILGMFVASVMWYVMMVYFSEDEQKLD